MKTEDFEVSGGSVIGYEHREKNGNCQDGLCVLATNNIMAAVVTDGCSQGKFSEVGARIGARILCEKILREAECNPDNIKSPEFWQSIRLDALNQIGALAKTMGGNFLQIIIDYFLFTVVGFLLTEKKLATFSIGDGIIAVNDKITQLGPFPSNEPPYLTYGLTGSTITTANPELLRFRVETVEYPEQISSVLIGTDGVADFIQAENKKMPGGEELLGPLSQFWTNTRFFSNPDMVRRKLALANRKTITCDWEKRAVIKEPCLLPDDTTLVVMRSKRQGG